MSKQKDMQETERPRGGGGFHGPMGAAGAGSKPMDFKGSARRLLGHLAPQRLKVAFVILAGVISVALAAVGPRVLGQATDLIFSGLIGRMFPSGMTQAEAIAAAEAAGNDQVAQMLGGIDLIPGVGVDFAAVAQVLLLVLGIYLVSSLLQFL